MIDCKTNNDNVLQARSDHQFYEASFKPKMKKELRLERHADRYF